MELTSKKNVKAKDTLREKCPNAWLFLVRIFLYSVQIRKMQTGNNSVFGHFSRNDKFNIVTWQTEFRLVGWSFIKQYYFEKFQSSRSQIFLKITWIYFSRITGLQGKREGISLSPHCHFHPFHRHLDINRAITAESPPLHIANSKSLTTKLCAFRIYFLTCMDLLRNCLSQKQYLI